MLKNKKSNLAGAIIMALSLPAITLAEDTPTPPAEAKPLQIWGFDFTGFVDVGYTNFTTGSGKFIGGAHSRVFDFENDGLNLQNLDLTLAKQPESGFGGLLDLTIGKDADTIAAYGTIDRNRGPANGVNKKFDVTQAFVRYAVGPFTLIGGKFVTNAGAEVIKSRDDTNYSRSILFGYAIPFSHTGLRATYKASDTLTLLGGINEGWDTIQNKNNAATAELGVQYTPTKEVSLVGSFYNGREKVFNYPTTVLAASPIGTRNLLDLVGTYNATDKLNFVLNYDYGSQQNAPLASGTPSGTAKWQGFAGYVNYTINDNWKVSVRGEYFDDKDGYRTVVAPGQTSGQKWKEATFTVAYTAIKNLELRGELRFDRSDQNVFLDRDGVTAKESQNSIGLEAIYKF